MRISDWSSDVCSSDLRLCTYIGTSVSVLVLRRRYGDREQALHLLGGPLIPIAAKLLSIGLLVSASIENLIAGELAVLLGAVISGFRRRLGRADERGGEDEGVRMGGLRWWQGK